MLSGKSFIFSGGELQTELKNLVPGQGVQLLQHLQSPGSILELLLTKEIIDRLVGRNVNQKLVIPYFPYARQDRVTKPSVAFSLKVIAKLINDLGFDEVVTCDVHSDVASALVDRIRVISQVDLITKHFPGLDQFINSEVTAIIAPDAGAVKKANAVGAAYKLPVFQASKTRDTETGKISHTKIQDDVRNYDCLIVDDICDGGRTFTDLAKVLRDGGAKKVSLYVTHGIFSAGYDVFKGLIDRIYTTDCFIPKTMPLPGETPLFIQHLPFMEL